MADEGVQRAASSKHWARALVDESFDKVSAPATAMTSAASGASTALGEVRHRTESMAGHGVVSLGLGALLGAIDGTVGPEPGGYSVDGLIGFVAALASMGSAEKMPGVSSYMRTTAAVGLSGWSRRKVGGFFGGVLHGAGVSPGGDDDASHSPQTPDEDPIVQFARSRAA